MEQTQGAMQIKKAKDNMKLKLPQLYTTTTRTFAWEYFWVGLS